jgi:hypothetical protein
MLLLFFKGYTIYLHDFLTSSLGSHCKIHSGIWNGFIIFKFLLNCLQLSWKLHFMANKLEVIIFNWFFFYTKNHNGFNWEPVLYIGGTTGTCGKLRVNSAKWWCSQQNFKYFSLAIFTGLYIWRGTNIPGLWQIFSQDKTS